MSGPARVTPLVRLLGPPVLLALILRLLALNTGLWFDEIWTLVDFGRLPIGRLLTTYGSDNNHPLYTLLARICLAIFGEHVWSLRLPALVFGLLSIVEAGRLALRLIGSKAAFGIATFLALFGPHVWFSTNARGYTALLYFSLLATRYLLEMKDDRSRGLMIKQALALALGSWVHATAVFVAMAQFLGGALVLRGERRTRVLVAVLLSGAFSLALHAPILREMIGFLAGGEGHAKVASSWSSPLWMLREAAARFGLPFPLAILGGVLGLAVGLLGLVRLGRVDRMIPVMFVGPALVGAVTMLALDRNLWPRFFFFELGFALIVLFAALLGEKSEVRSFKLRDGAFGLVLAAVALGSLLAAKPFMPKQDFAAAARYADELPAGRVATVGLARMPFAEYLHRPYAVIEDRAQLEAMLESGEVYVINTLPIYLESREPEIAAVVKERGQVEKVFPGSVGGGEIVVWRLR